MILKSLKVKNIRTFKDTEISFGKINYLTGYNYDTEDRNGIGKSALIQAFLTLLGGSKLTTINLSKLIRNGASEGIIEGTIETSSGDILEITRTLKKKGSGSLTIKVNNEDPNYSISSQYQDLIFEYIGDADSFKKFRIVDKSSGINILDFTPTQFRKTLMAMCQDKFEIIRQNALEKKREFEKFSASHIISHHAPSEKRLSLIEMAIADIESEELEEIKKKINEFAKEKGQLLNEKGKAEQTERIRKGQAYKLNSINSCPTCFQEVPSIHKKNILQSLNKDIKKAQEEIAKIIKKLKIYDDIISTEERKEDKIYKQKERLLSLQHKLETRLQQKEYKYTEQDIELAKKAIEEIDKFANYYILEWINTIEPIVNSYLSILGMEFSFNVNKSGNPNPIVKRDKEILDYDQLSQGEKIFVSVIFKIALLLENNDTGCLIADEGLDSLSVENLNRITEVASNLPIQLLAVSHNPELDTSRAKVIYIEKRKGLSTIKEKE